MGNLKLYEEFIKSLSDQEVSETNNSYKIFLELLEADIYDAKVKNPETGKAIKIASALKKDPRTDVYQVARKLVDKSKGSNEDEEESSKKFSPVTTKKLAERLGGIEETLKGQDEDTQKRGKLFKEYTEEFINAKSEKEQVEAIQKLIDANLIQGHSGGVRTVFSLPISLRTTMAPTRITSSNPASRMRMKRISCDAFA
jgi:2',3'-cyclic-nucleotide 2'-phosphodiesterase (5'-nucleotidase family)